MPWETSPSPTPSPSGNRIPPRATPAPTPSPSAGTAAAPSSGLTEADFNKMFTEWATGQQDANDPPVIREPSRVLMTYPTSASMSVAKTAPYSQYSGEYGLKLQQDPVEFQKWLTTRATAFNFDLLDAEGNFNVKAGEGFWTYIGGLVASNPTLRTSVSPEQYADQRYLAMGGDTAYEKYLQTKQVAKENPIYTSTSTSYNTMPPQAAEAAVDDLARALLGRMATEKEMNRYRKQINSFLKANPSTSTSVSNSDTNTTTSVSKSGASPSDALAILEQRFRRGSEGMAFNAGKMIEQALTGGGL